MELTGLRDNQKERSQEMKRTLPQGTFVRLTDLAPQTTDKDIQELIRARTGVEIPIERISVVSRWNDNAAFVSFGFDHFTDIIAWALAEDSLHGKPFSVVKTGGPTARGFEAA
jgi:hypothetical protein